MPIETLEKCNFCSAAHFRTVDATANLVSCAECGTVFVSPRPSLGDLKEYYSKPSKYDVWLGQIDARDALWKRRLMKIRRVKRPGKLLDVGTGIGQFLYLAKPEFREVEGLEISSSAIAIARERYGLNVRQGTIEELDFNTTYDNITLFHVLEHVHDPRFVLEKCKSLLNDNGLLIIAVPNDLRSMELRIRNLRRRIGKYGIPPIVLDGSVDEIHLSQFTPATLARNLERLGFTVLENSLDPYFAMSGWKLRAHQLYYAFHSVLNALFGVNFYNTIWVAARK